MATARKQAQKSTLESDLGKFIKGKRILVTGGTGSIGRIIVERLLQHDPKIIRILSRDTGKQINLQEKLNAGDRLRFILGDIRDQERLMTACEDIDIIFHAAAFKYVPQGEYNPFETVQTNVIGTQNLISVALKTPSVTHFVMISTDKAVSPTSTMGASKLLAERIVSAAHYIKGKKNKVFTTVRFGNVLGTAGSVIPIFKEQAAKGQITITHPQMARFFMTIPDAVQLVLDAALLAKGGEIFVLKMPVVKIKDLAEVCATRFSKEKPARVAKGTIRAGERIQEALLTEDEARTALETDAHYIIVPQINIADVSSSDYSYPNAKARSSKNYQTATSRPLSKKAIGELLDRAGL